MISSNSKKALVICADDLQINSSANLCHLSYIRGLLDLDYEVDLVCAEKSNAFRDISMTVPNEVRIYAYDGVSIYEKIAGLRNKSISNTLDAKNDNPILEDSSHVQGVKQLIKSKIRSLYGVYGFYRSFARRAFNYQNKEKYEVVISLSDPHISHYLAYKLIKYGHISTDRWIQIWEDPWTLDLYNSENNDRIRKEEKKILSYAEAVCYVTPLTLHYQKLLFPEYADKMFWKPLPAYYATHDNKAVDLTECVLGYFGDYYPFSRNLTPFYDAVRQKNIETYICGNPSNLFESIDNIHILPRMPIDELHQYEAKVNVLVFVCNLKGGQIPGKIYQYSATFKKILFILDGTDEEKAVLKDYFSTFHRYYFCENNVESIMNAIYSMQYNTIQDVINEPVTKFKPVNIMDELLTSSSLNKIVN